jgi:hypothetical protein
MEKSLFKKPSFPDDEFTMTDGMTTEATTVADYDDDNDVGDDNDSSHGDVY